MAVGHVVAVLIIGSTVVSHRVFGNAVSNQLTVLILRKVCEAPAPVVGCGHSLAGNLFAVLQQVDGDAGRTLVVLIVRIFPGFAAGYRDLLKLMSIGDDKDAIFLFDAAAVTLNRHFLDGIDDVHTFILQRKILKGAGPVIDRAQDERLVGNLFTIRQQLHGHARRTLVVLIVVVVPNLLNRNARGRGLRDGIGIGNGDLRLRSKFDIHRFRTVGRAQIIARNPSAFRDFLNGIDTFRKVG